MSTAENQTERQASPISLKDAFKEAARAKPRRVDLSRFHPALRDTYVTAPPSAEIAAWESSGLEYDKKGNVSPNTSPTRKAELIVRCITDARGNRIWTSSDSDVQAVATMRADLVGELFRESLIAIGHRRLVDDEEEEGKEPGN